MKKIISTILFLTIMALVAFSQSRPINYQAVARDVDGSLLIETALGIRTSILYNNPSGPTVYREEFNVKTDGFGVLNINIGNGSVLNGAFSTIDWSAGDFYLKIEIDVTGGTTYSELGTTQLVSVPFAKYAEKAGEGTFPEGLIMTFAGSKDKVPEGWMLCDGRELSRTEYAELFNAIGINWGIGDQITTFNIPDLRGMFLRGVDDGVGNDPDAVDRKSKNNGNTGDMVGSFQQDMFKTHNHTIHLRQLRSTSDTGDGINGFRLDKNNLTPTGYARILDEGGSETRPKNANVIYIIKY